MESQVKLWHCHNTSIFSFVIFLVAIEKYIWNFDRILAISAHFPVTSEDGIAEGNPSAKQKKTMTMKIRLFEFFWWVSG